MNWSAFVLTLVGLPIVIALMCIWASFTIKMSYRIGDTEGSILFAAPLIIIVAIAIGLSV